MLVPDAGCCKRSGLVAALGGRVVLGAMGADYRFNAFGRANRMARTLATAATPRHNSNPPASKPTALRCMGRVNLVLYPFQRAPSATPDRRGIGVARALGV